MTDYYAVAHPCDLLDEDLALALDRLHGEIGVNGLAVWAAAPESAWIRGRGINPRLLRSRGGLFFLPDESRYHLTRLKPVTSERLKSRDVFSQITDGCDQRGLKVRALVSASRAGRLPGKYPAMTCKNALGDDSQVSLCLAHPDVQAYLTALVTDLTSERSLAGVILADFEIFWAEADDPRIAADLNIGVGGRRLLGLCFCESCRQGATLAGVDVDKAIDTVRLALDRWFPARTPVSADGQALLEVQPALAAFLRFQDETLMRLKSRLREASSHTLFLLEGEPGTPWATSTFADPAVRPIRSLDTVNLNELERQGVTAPEQSELCVTTQALRHATSADLVSFFQKATEWGVSAILVDGYGKLAERDLNALRQAIRFARRSSAS
ncbi:MAG: hypothetical protein JSV78_08065 [Phycisphaerales bacterium]|nr:MAG: hypothetical protein JSV78_08065 [Phycisphaerales bacterium]